MSDETNETSTSEEPAEESSRTKVEKGIPSRLVVDFSRSEEAQALRPGFRNPGNKNSKVQKRKRKGRKK